jgi:hypothetical protein
MQILPAASAAAVKRHATSCQHLFFDNAVVPHYAIYSSNSWIFNSLDSALKVYTEFLGQHAKD